MTKESGIIPGLGLLDEPATNDSVETSTMDSPAQDSTAASLLPNSNPENEAASNLSEQFKNSDHSEMKAPISDLDLIAPNLTKINLPGDFSTERLPDSDPVKQFSTNSQSEPRSTSSADQTISQPLIAPSDNDNHGEDSMDVDANPADLPPEGNPSTEIDVPAEQTKDTHFPATSLLDSLSSTGAVQTAEGSVIQSADEAIPPTSPAVGHSPLNGVEPVQLLEVTGLTSTNEGAEFEVDSDPYESSTDSSSDDSSSDEEGNDDYKFLSVEEQAQRLMAGSDDEEDSGVKTASVVKTKNEVAPEIIPKPNVVIEPNMQIGMLGQVEHMLKDGSVVIKSTDTGTEMVRDIGSVLCLEDRTVLGVVAEVFGPTHKSFYLLRFTKLEEATEAGIKDGTRVFYSVQHSKNVFHPDLRAFKGSDASNLHDEEVGEEEMEFSDDEKEMEHKKKLKQKKQERRGGSVRGGRERHRNEAHPLSHEQGYEPVVGLSYDDEDDGLYTPLARPAGFVEGITGREAPQEGSAPTVKAGSSTSRGFSRGGQRGGRGRGSYDRHRGGFRQTPGPPPPYPTRQNANGFSHPQSESPINQPSSPLSSGQSQPYGDTQQRYPTYDQRPISLDHSNQPTLEYDPRNAIPSQWAGTYPRPAAPHIFANPSGPPYGRPTYPRPAAPHIFANPSGSAYEQQIDPRQAAWNPPALPPTATGAWINPAFYGNQPRQAPPPQQQQTAPTQRDVYGNWVPTAAQQGQMHDQRAMTEAESRGVARGWGGYSGGGFEGGPPR